MKKGIIILLTVIFMSVILFFISCPIVNNISAKHIIEDINTIPLPPLETPTRKDDTLPLCGAHIAFSCYPTLRPMSSS